LSGYAYYAQYCYADKAVLLLSSGPTPAYLLLPS
jgi:hypothetical protein